MTKQAVILCGGLGTRMAGIASNLPKCLLPIRGVPLLTRTIELLQRHGICNVILAAGHKGEIIRDYFALNPVLGISVEVSIEHEPLGTAGPVRQIGPCLDEDFLLLYGDVFLDCNISELARRHQTLKPMATLVVRQSDHPWDSHLVELNAQQQVTGFILKQEPNQAYQNIANAAVYCLSKKIVDFIPANGKSDFVCDVFPSVLKKGLPIAGYLLRPGEYVKDMGTPERLRLVENHLEERELVEMARRDRRPISTVFLDRDGVINRNVGLICDPSMVELVPGAAEGIKLLNEHGIKTVVITNQPVIARGLCDEMGLEQIHARLKQELAKYGAHLDGLYYCPHHPETQHGEGRRELRRACECRKPNIGLFMQARKELDIDLRAAIMVGDSHTDILAGHRAGLRTVLIDPLPNGRSGVSPDYTSPGLREAAEAIISGNLD